MRYIWLWLQVCLLLETRDKRETPGVNAWLRLKLLVYLSMTGTNKAHHNLVLVPPQSHFHSVHLGPQQHVFIRQIKVKNKQTNKIIKNHSTTAHNKASELPCFLQLIHTWGQRESRRLLPVVFRTGDQISAHLKAIKNGI